MKKEVITIIGVIPFDIESRILYTPERYPFKEIVREGAFKRSLLKNNVVPVLRDHNDNRRLGYLRTNSNDLYEDKVGLRFRFKTNDWEIVELARKGKLWERGWSFTFTPNRNHWNHEGFGVVRELIDVELKEISLIVDRVPAYPKTLVDCVEYPQYKLANGGITK